MGGSTLLFRTQERVTIHLEISRILLYVDRLFVLHSLPVFAFVVHETII